MGIARDASRETLGQAARGGERQHRDRVGAAERRGERGDRGAQNIHMRIAPRHRAPRRFGGNKCRLRRKPARGLDARPQFPQRAEFRDGQKLIGVGREAEENHAPRDIEGDAAGFERAQIGQRDAEHEGQFLRFRPAGIVHDAAIGDGKLAEKTRMHQGGDAAGKMRGFLAPRARRGPRDRHRADRVVADTHAGAIAR